MRATTAGSIAAIGGIDRFRSKRIFFNWFRWKGGKEKKKIEEKNKKILELKENILKNEALDEKDKKLFIKNIESIIN